MIEKSVKLQALEELPEFRSYPFTREMDQPAKRIPVYEIARITYIDKRKEGWGVVGRSPDKKTIYGSINIEWGEDGKIVALGDDSTRSVEVDLIDMYEILFAHEILASSQPTRRF